jgi:hypothetical protein
MEVAECGSSKQAASKLYMTQQSVSKYVTMMENELKATLFVRDRSGLGLTTAGQYYRSLFRSATYSFDLLLARIENYYAEMNSNVRIGCSEWINPYGELYDAVSGFRKEHKNIRFSLGMFGNNSLAEMLQNNDLDIALFSTTQVPADNDFETIPLAKEEICIIGPDDVVGETLSPGQRGKRMDMTCLVVPGWERSYTETVVMSAYERHGFEIPVSKIRLVPNLTSQYLAMEKKEFLTISERRFGIMGEIEGLDSELLDVDSSVCACIPRQTENSSVRELIDYMKNALNAQDGS